MARVQYREYPVPEFLRAHDAETIYLVGAVGMAGVMGGQGTSITEDVTDVLLEVAYFDPQRVRASRLPLGLSTDAPRVVATVEDLAARERARWRDGLASGAVYHGGDDHVAFLNRVYAAASQVNPLHADLWPSGAKFEAEIVSMTAAMLGGDAVVLGEHLLQPLALGPDRDRVGHTPFR